jgi:hypothetical protein
MGVNTNTYLPATVELNELVLVIQRLTDADEVVIKQAGPDRGLTARRGDEFSNGNDWFDLYITREDGFGDGDTGHSGMVSMNSDHEGMKNAINVHGGNASVFWASLGDALVEFYGGIVDYNDCDAEYADTRKRATVNARNMDAFRDGEWDRKKARINALTTVTDTAGLKKYDTTVGLYNRKGEYRSMSEGRVKVYHKAGR